MNTKFIYTIVGMIVILAAGIVFYTNHNKNIDSVRNVPGSANNTPAQTPATSQTNPPATQGGKTMTAAQKACADGSQKDANGRFKPSVDISKKVVTLDTSMGKIQLQLFDKDAPKTVQNFVCLSENGYYNNVKFHRVAHGFVIQAGDPTGTGSGGESIFGGKFEDELYADTASFKAGYIKGTLAMANSGPNTNGSQFFIMTADVPLAHNYTIFGKVISGLDVVTKIGAVPVTPGFGPEDGPPVTPIIIKSATVSTAK
jgi:cyclophilin family peptidyl-prolyl cis-trans isomerase